MYDEVKNKITTEKMKNRDKMVSTLTSHNDNFRLRIMKVKSSMDKTKLDRDWGDKRRYESLVTKFGPTGQQKTVTRATSLLNKMHQEIAERSRSYTNNLDLDVDHQSRCAGIPYDTNPFQLIEYKDNIMPLRPPNDKLTTNSDRNTNTLNNDARTQKTSANNNRSDSVDQLSNFGNIGKNLPKKGITDRNSASSLIKPENLIKDKSKRKYINLHNMQNNKTVQNEVERIGTGTDDLKNIYMNEEIDVFLSNPQQKPTIKSNNASATNSSKSFKNNYNKNQNVRITNLNSDLTKTEPNIMANKKNQKAPEKVFNNQKANIVANNNQKDPKKIGQINKKIGNINNIKSAKNQNEEFPQVVTERTEPNVETAKPTKTENFFEKMKDDPYSPEKTLQKQESIKLKPDLPKTDDFDVEPKIKETAKPETIKPENVTVSDSFDFLKTTKRDSIKVEQNFPKTDDFELPKTNNEATRKDTIQPDKNNDDSFDFLDNEEAYETKDNRPENEKKATPFDIFYDAPLENLYEKNKALVEKNQDININCNDINV